MIIFDLANPKYGFFTFEIQNIYYRANPKYRFIFTFLARFKVSKASINSAALF